MTILAKLTIFLVFFSFDISEFPYIKTFLT